jgi:hypothetical protein
MSKSRFNPWEITTSMILSNDDHRIVSLQSQTPTFRRNLTLKPIPGHSGGARLAGGQTPKSRMR